MPTGWECKKHDKSLLKAANEKGFNFLQDLSDNSESGFKDIHSISKNFAVKRIEKICEYFRDLQTQTKIPKKAKFSYDTINLKPTVQVKEIDNLTIEGQMKVLPSIP